MIRAVLYGLLCHATCIASMLPETAHIVDVTNDYRAIFRSSDTAAAALLAAAITRHRVHTTLAYDSATREENLWQHLTAQTTQSCQDLVPLIAGIQDVQDQYISLVELLKTSGPCAPGFTGYDLLQDPGDASFKDSECVMTATTAEDTGRDALLVVQRQYTHEGRVYDYAAQYLTPALVRQFFGNPSRNGAQVSFCNVRDREHSPAAIETALSRVGLWTLPQDVAATDAGIVVEMPQIRQSGICKNLSGYFSTSSCPSGQFESESMVPNEKSCYTCPTDTVSLHGSTSVDACECPVGSFQETRVLNPPYTQRSYSSIWPNEEELHKSLLDDMAAATYSGSSFDWGASWSASSESVGEWMQIDTGQPMLIVGIISQGRGTPTQEQYVTEFRVEYWLGDALGVGIEFPGTFSMTNGLKKEHIFPAPIYARYIRIVVLQWNIWISMRTALIVKSCLTCFSNAVSLQGSTGSSACECLAGSYKHTSAFSNRAIALVPGRASQLSTLANRNQRLFAATAQFDSTAGPPGSKGAVIFDRGFSQYLDGGTHTFNIASNGGFTAVAVVKFSGTKSMSERILDLARGKNNDNIIICRDGSGTRVFFGIWNGGQMCRVSSDNVIVQDMWLSIVATYTSSTKTLRLKVGGNSFSKVCSTARTDRVSLFTYVGKSSNIEDYFQGSIAGIYTVDALLGEAEISSITSKMNTGDDTLQVCQTCPSNTNSLQGSTQASACSITE